MRDNIMELELVDKSAYDDNKDKNSSVEETQYDGAERRYGERRCGHDRRSMIRFELGKEDRRQVDDRRNATNVWDKGHTMF